MPWLDVSYQSLSVRHLPNVGRDAGAGVVASAHTGIANGRQAEMAELADALDSGSSPRKGVEVRVLFSAFSNQQVSGTCVLRRL